MFTLSRKYLQETIRETFSRFLIPTIIIIVSSIVLSYFVYSDNESEVVIKSILMFSIIFFFSIWISLYLESKEKTKYNFFLQVIPIIYGIYTYIIIDIWADWFFESFIYLWLHLTWFISFVFFAPYILSYFNKNRGEIEYSNYFSLTSWTFFMSGIVGASVLLLWFIAIGSIIALFDISFSEWKAFWYWAVFALVFCAPLYWLMHFPIVSNIDKANFEINRFFSFLIRYIGVPFIYIYFIILYTYSIKVVMNFWDWPNWIISWMVIGFSVFGYINYIFSRPYEWKMISYFRKYFPIVVIPQIIMLFYAIYLRIEQYDLTMNRYFVVIFGIWLLMISLYFVISKRKSLLLITISLTLVSFIVSIGPWSVFTLPLERQYNRLILNLENAKILKDNTIYPLKSPQDINKELSNDIYSWIEYVCDYSECSLIKELFKKELEKKQIQSEMEFKKSNKDSLLWYTGLSKWDIINEVTEQIKVQRNYEYSQSSKNSKYLQFNANQKGYWPYPLDIDDKYNKIINVYKDEKSTVYYQSYPYPFITIDLDENILKYHKSENNIHILPLVLNTNLNKDTPSNLEQQDLIFKISDNTIDIKLVLQNFAIKNPEYTWWWNNYYTIYGIALVKEILKQ